MSPNPSSNRELPGAVPPIDQPPNPSGPQFIAVGRLVTSIGFSEQVHGLEVVAQRLDLPFRRYSPQCVKHIADGQQEDADDFDRRIARLTVPADDKSPEYPKNVPCHTTRESYRIPRSGPMRIGVVLHEDPPLEGFLLQERNSLTEGRQAGGRLLLQLLTIYVGEDAYTYLEQAKSIRQDLVGAEVVLGDLCSFEVETASTEP